MMKLGTVFLTVLAALLCACEADSMESPVRTAFVPAYTGHKAVSGRQVDFHFSSEVRVLSAKFEPEAVLESFCDGNTVSFVTETDNPVGQKFTADVLVEDNDGNTLNVVVPFRMRNEDMPRLRINEVRFDHNKQKSEFVEFKILSEGNLAALQLYVTSAKPFEPLYEFPAAKVHAGEFIVLHLRSLQGDKAIDEVGENIRLAASGAKGENLDLCRDFWLGGNTKTIHKTDVIYLLDQDGMVIDGLVVGENEKAWSKNPAFAEAAGLLARQEKWIETSNGFLNAAMTEGTTPTRTLNRHNNAVGPDAWYVCTTGKASPGKVNSPAVYNK